MKKKILMVVLALTLILSACSAGGNTSGNNVNEKGILAEVNGVEISRKDYSEMLDLYANFYAVNYGINSQVRNLMIQDELIRQDLKENNVEVSDDYVKEFIDSNIESLGGKEVYEEMLLNNNVSDEQYRKSIESNAYYTKHKEWFNENHQPSQEDIETYYKDNMDRVDQYELSHILVDTKEEADAVIERLNNGEEFADVAKEVSKDTASAQNGGSLGKSTLDQFVPEFAEGAKKLEVGEISDPIESTFGFHIIKLDGKTVGVDENKEVIIDLLNNEKYTEYLGQLQEKADIVDPNEKTPEVDGGNEDEGQEENPESSENPEETKDNE